MNQPGRRLLTIRDLMALTGDSRSTIYRDLHSGLIPAPITVGCNRIRWRSDEIDSWLQSLPTRNYTNTPEADDGR